MGKGAQNNNENPVNSLNPLFSEAEDCPLRCEESAISELILRTNLHMACEFIAEAQELKITSRHNTDEINSHSTNALDRLKI